MSNPFYRINHQIQAKQVRLLREDGTQIGIVSKEEALSQASKDQLDAVEIAPNADPPVVKLIDYKKFLYQIAKREQAAKAAAKKVDLKEIRLTPFMAENDLQVKLDRGKEFLTEGHKLRVTVRFVGRQLGHKEFGPQMMARAVSALSDISQIDQDGKWIGRQFTATLSPVKK
ncbi:MAG: Translation initiation factor IF-3 [Candidatus Amesbacteria bacterium GW2011_GWA1_47_16]|uniref:Translation initiation factor IF-3 n=5 Tax=Candidatus Amesiibacteriota TaxID=1752730 RepID=A0A1F4ZYA8_9BACT|nr:MAG: Translation initiation factor IF-3 [Candidatus Amesbacteria bacterium GW2011_GWA1_47_16]KKU64669.1 MAG: Translation initiation factor IF-3 [Candidatus Amesbacteria bacterium GW2011_GWC1_47_15]KKU97395.1 MAG: Translation initiation factor IF-3 [Candidatus Amesbacteria bacterium GW2011_GWB1_48_13]OGC98571.1 MAG: translation initiation factor IF-3 [Candidatus Amesbacteria bacterium RIFCSPHIGHO2_01_FULL_47_34]OGD00031.1 MAG: translation initiation factor IF-3 [Candidatus Amesbacteria bacter